MLLLLTWTGIAGLLAGSLYVALQLAGLPYAPECPTCRGVTCAPVRLSRMDRVLAACGGADARLCTRCGWQGRMRWRLAAVRARRK
ncbi:hypothetical protein [Longimicrobium sp.]|uniref:hypothetical protein n=1 Tax=Longimicrobium sp. TaxID=2029185 RepID=UPI002E322778|nr:hypothetical protein [Longimicrobium sp.]HEX6041427.1 hypothetical protein [Longimicrobium sp.]